MKKIALSCLFAQYDCDVPRRKNDSYFMKISANIIFIKSASNNMNTLRCLSTTSQT